MLATFSCFAESLLYAVCLLWTAQALRRGERGYCWCVHRLLRVELPWWSAALGPPASGLQPVFSKAVAHGPSCSVAFEIFPDQTKPASPALAGRFLPTVPPGTSCFKSLKIVHPVWGWSIIPHCHNVHIKFECWKLHSLHIVTFLP